MSKKHVCPVCGKTVFEGYDFDICEVCGWEDDVVQASEPDSDFGANHLSLNDYKKAYEAGEISYEILRKRSESK